MTNIEPFGRVWLHGSRYMASRTFGCNKVILPEDTDWDYAAQHTQPWQQVYEAAIKEGWVEVVTESYKDNNTAYVFEKMLGDKKVQVSLRQNLQQYQDCYNGISPDFYFKYLWKKSPSCLPVEDRKKYYNQLYYAWETGANKDLPKGKSLEW